MLLSTFTMASLDNIKNRENWKGGLFLLLEQKQNYYNERIFFGRGEGGGACSL